MRIMSPLLLVLAIVSCKSRQPADSEAKGLVSTIDDLIPSEALRYERYKRNKDRPWVSWQWLPGTRNDFGEPKNLRVAGVDFSANRSCFRGAQTCVARQYFAGLERAAVSYLRRLVPARMASGLAKTYS